MSADGPEGTQALRTEIGKVLALSRLHEDVAAATDKIIATLFADGARLPCDGACVPSDVVVAIQTITETAPITAEFDGLYAKVRVWLVEHQGS